MAQSIGFIALLGASAVAAHADGFDADAFLKQLQDPATQQQAAEKIPTLPEAAIVPLVEAADSDQSPPDLRKALNAQLPALYARCRQERQKSEAALNQAWMNSQLVDVYRKTHPDTKADAAVMKVFAALSVGKSDYADAKAAVDAGSDDPVIRFCCVVEGIASREMPVERAIKQIEPALDGMDASDYSNGVKFLMHRRLAFVMQSDDWPAGMTVNTNLRDDIEDCLLDLPDYIAEKPGRKVLSQAVWDSYSLLTGVMGDEKKAYDRLAPILKNAMPNDPIADWVAAEFDESWAWDARGSGVASTVTDDGWKLFGQRLEQESTVATQGWKADPLSSQCACSMIVVAQGRELGEDMMEQWFRRATLADPDDITAYERKAYYLSPQWFGGIAEAVAFGRECVQIGNGRNRIPLVLLEVWNNIANIEQNSNAVYQRPEVWKDIRSVYEKLLADKSRLTDDRAGYLTDRSDFLALALKCHQFQAFLDLSKAFGDDIDFSFFGGKDRYAYYQHDAAAQQAATSQASK